MRLSKLVLLLGILGVLLLQMQTGTASGSIFVEDADAVRNFSFNSASEDALNSTDAPGQGTCIDVYVCDTDAARDFNLSTASEDALDSSDAAQQETVIDVYVCDAGAVRDFSFNAVENPTPICKIELRDQGATSSIDEVNVWESFDIYVGDSTGDQDITEVRFSSDESQDGNPTGEWTDWYDWATSSGDWDAANKIKAWAFATSGDKEVWAEVKDGDGVTDKGSADIYAIDIGNPPPDALIELREQGTTSSIDEVNVGEFFDIYVGDSTGDQDITEVRFSSDESQDGNPMGEWTDWYNWDISSGDWDAVNKIKRWSFATDGAKEVWADVKDGDGKIGKDSDNIYARGIGNQPPVALFTYSPETPKSGEWVIFDASYSNDLDGKIVLYEWDWGNTGVINDRSADSRITYYWAYGGTYQVRLIVTDNHGATSTHTKDVIIAEDTFWESVKGKWPWSKELRTINEDEFKQIKWFLNIHNFPYPYPKENYVDRSSDKDANPDSNVDLYWYDDGDLRKALDKELDHEKTPGLTYGIYILNAINEGRMVEYVWTQEYKKNSCEFFNVILDMNIDWSSVASGAAEDFFSGLLSEPYSSGASTLFLSYDVAQVGISISTLKKTLYYNSLWWYLHEERACGSTHEAAWKSIQREDGWAPQDYRVPSRGLFESEAEYKKRLDALEIYYKNLWAVYGDALENNQLDDFKYNLKDQLRAVLHSVLQRHKPELLDWVVICAKSPIELRVYGSQGEVTGVVRGETKEELPYSVYGDMIKTVVIFCPSESYRYEVIGTDGGTYGLDLASIEGGEATTFTATDIPTAVGVTHEYTIDWTALSQGEAGVTVQVDSDGDGTFEYTFTADNELTQEEFLSGTDGEPIPEFTTIAIPVAIVLGLVFLISRRKRKR